MPALDILSPSAHAQSILALLAQRVLPQNSKIATPFGVSLTPAQGRFAVGERVLAQGIDDCSALQLSAVMAVGTRSDHPGIWYLLRGLRHGDTSLVRGDALRTAPERQPARVRPAERDACEQFGARYEPLARFTTAGLQPRPGCV